MRDTELSNLSQLRDSQLAIEYDYYLSIVGNK
jgi:hypothetical protein